MNDLPGDNEKTLVDWAVDYAKVRRTAKGTVRGEEVVVTASANGDDWSVRAHVVGSGEISNTYPSRGDAYRAFEFLKEEHELTEAADE